MYSRCKYAWTDFFYHLVLTRRSHMYERFPFEIIIDQVISLVRLLLSFLSYIYILSLSLSRLFANDISAFGANSHDILRVSWYQYRGGVTTTGAMRASLRRFPRKYKQPYRKADRCVSLIINHVHVAYRGRAKSSRRPQERRLEGEIRKKGSGGSVFSVLLVRSFAILVSA